MTSNGHSRFVKLTTERIDLGAGDWVEMRTRLSYGDRAAIEEKLLGPTSTSNASTLQARDLQIAAANVELLLRTVVAWGGPGFCGLEHPHDGDHVAASVNEEQIRALDATAERILAELQNRMVTRTPGFQTPPSQPRLATEAGETDDSNADSSRSASSSDLAGTMRIS